MAFTGRAIYDDGVFSTIAEDVSDIIGMISPTETPLLDLLPQAERPATNVLHEWLEDAMSPNTVVASSNVASTTADTAVGLAGGLASFIQVGAVLEGPVKTAGEAEKFQVTAVAGNTITVSRAFGGSSANSFAAGQTIFVIADAALEGADVSDDTSRPRSRRTNYCQIFKKDIIISGTSRAVRNLANVGDEMTYQITKKLRESLRDLEKAVIRGTLSGNTIGSATAYRTMRGVRSFISTNVQSIGTTLTESWLGNTIKTAWDNGGTDLDTIIVDAVTKRQIDAFHGAGAGAGRPVVANNADRNFAQLVSAYENAFGRFNVVLNRWMPANEAMIVASRRIRVVPLQGRAFRFEAVAKTGDADKGMVLGEYTVEMMNEEGMARLYVV